MRSKEHTEDPQRRLAFFARGMRQLQGLLHVDNRSQQMT